MPHHCPGRMRPMTIPRGVGAVVVLLLGAVFACAQAPPTDANQGTFETLCSSCHSPQVATHMRQTRAQWLQTVNQMVARGAQGTDEQLLAVVDYLSEHYGRVNVNSGPASELEQVGGFSAAEAEAIVNYRRTQGSIEGVSELSKASGVPENELQEKGEALTFGTLLPGVGRVPVSALTESYNWPTISASPQRDGWSREEEMISPQTAGNMKLVYRHKIDNSSRGLRALTSPIVLGALIGYQGFKQMLILGGADQVDSIDADLNRDIWKQSFHSRADKPKPDAALECTPAPSAVVMPGSTEAGSSGGPSIRRRGAAPSQRNNSLFVSAFGRTGPVAALSSDGTLHVLYQSNGADAMPPLKFVPAGSVVRGFNLDDATLYAATAGNCGGPNALYAVDLDSGNDDPGNSKVVSFLTNGSGASGSAGTAIGSDGTVYAQVAEGHGAAAGQYNDTVLAFTPGELKVKDYFTPPGALPALRNDPRPQGATPMVFSLKGRELILAGGRDGRLYVLDPASLGGADHHTPLFRSEPIATHGSVREAFATWEDPNTDTGWVYASLWGPAAAAAEPAAKNGTASDGGIAAFKVEERGETPILTLAWISENMLSPSAPVVANGVVFALSTGLPSRLANGANLQQVESTAKPAVLYALDALTGKELFHSDDASSFSDAGGLAVANGRVYFTTHDNTVYAYGFPVEY